MGLFKKKNPVASQDGTVATEEKLTRQIGTLHYVLCVCQKELQACSPASVTCDVTGAGVSVGV